MNQVPLASALVGSGRADSLAIVLDGVEPAGRRPWGHVCYVDVSMPAAATVASLSHKALERTSCAGPGDIDSRGLWSNDVDAQSGGPLERLVDGIRTGLAAMPVPGLRGPEVRVSTSEGDMNWLSCQGAAFHNDTFGHWGHCLFWVLALDASDVEFVLPHIGVSLPMPPGRLAVFDPCLPHGLCRPDDARRWRRKRFEDSERSMQTFLGGEITLSEHSWRELGSPLCRGASDALRGFLDLASADIDEESGGVTNADACRIASDLAYHCVTRPPQW